MLGAYLYASIVTICNLQFNYSLFNKLLSKSTENSKKAKIISNFKNCYIKYKDWKQAI